MCINNCKKLLSATKILLAEKCIEILKNGSKTPFTYPFEFVQVPNAPSAIKHDEIMTDTVAFWVT
jgi:hypothetical protein